MKSFNPFGVEFAGTHLIEASAGTGKTYNIASLYIRSIIEGRPVDELLVVTYTNAAAKELRDRLMKRIRESIRALHGTDVREDTFLSNLKNEVSQKGEAIRKLKTASRNFDEAAVYTIHGFCQHVLQEFAFESGSSFSAELIGDDSEIIQEIIDDYWRNWVQENSRNENRRLLIKFILEQGYTPEKLAKELGGYVGKPYLRINPQKTGNRISDEKLEELTQAFKKLKQEWHANKSEVADLLHSDHLKNYRKNWLASWIRKMDKMVLSEAAHIQYFDQIKRFSQSFIDDNLKKPSIKKGVQPPQHRFFRQVDSFMRVADYLQEQKVDVVFKKALFAYLVEKLSEKKEDLQVYSYDDLLIHLKDALQNPQQGEKLCKKLRKKYPIALVDEFQDTDPVQYQIFKTIYAGNKETALFMIGDPKQSIYSFRGADVFVYLQARGETTVENRYSLEHNYRSSPSLLDAFNQFFGRATNPFLLESIPYQPVIAGKEAMDYLQIENSPAEPFVIRRVATAGNDKPLNKEEAEQRAAEDAASQIKKILDEIDAKKAKIGDDFLKAEDIAVLVRGHRQAGLMKEALTNRGIHCVTHSNANVFESEEARLLYIILKAVAEPADERLAAAALSTLLFEYSGNDLFELQEDDTKWAEKLDQFYRWNQLWQQHGFSYFFQTMMREENIAETVAKRREGERILTNISHLSSLIHEEEKHSGAGMHALIKWLLKKRQEDRNDADEEQLRLQSDENLVQVITQHHSKGLEYPVVFCPFLWYVKQNSDKGLPITYHDPDDMSQVILDLNGKDEPERDEKRLAQEKEIMEESLRLAYVALTRAKQKCIINWIYARESERSPMSYLLLSKSQDYESFKDVGKNIDDYLGKIQQSLDELDKHASICVETIKENDEEAKEAVDSPPVMKLEAKKFHRSLALPRGKDLSSFSSLTQLDHEVDFDMVEYYDQFILGQENVKVNGTGIFGFPKGPAPGTAIHHIFENINFANDDNWNEIIQKYLERENIDRKWQSVVFDMLQNVVNKPLLKSKPALNLAGVSPEKMIAEMQFHFSNRHVELQDLLNIIRPDSPQESIPESFTDEGFMTGFIDMTFCFDNQYYILDYKTNHLGNEVDDYNKEGLDEAMKGHFYDLQYHLYLVALHRFLKQKLPDYDYEKYIGGAFYLFVRGINEDSNAGIYYDHPDEARMNELDGYFKGEN